MSGVQRMRDRSATAFVKMNAQVLTLVFLQALLVALATGASIGGSVSLDGDSLSSEAEIVFPKIPGINKPLLPNLGDIMELLSGSKSGNNSTSNVSHHHLKIPSLPTTHQRTTGPTPKTNSTNIDNQTEKNFIPTNTPNDNGQTNDSSSSEEARSTDGQTNSASKPGLPKIPRLSDLIPKIPVIKDPSSVLLPRIPRLPSISDVAKSPELAAALEKARNMTAAAIGHGSDLISGIHTAMDQAIRSINPTKALRNLVGTILKTYLAVAKTDPRIAIGIKVLSEGIRLSFEVAKSIRNIIST